MLLNHSFTIPAPLDEAWDTLGNVEEVATCMPGATLGSFDGERFDGTVKVKVGPMQLTYRGEGRLVEQDDENHRIAIEAAGKETRGQGTARANVTAQLTAIDDRQTRVEVETDLDVTGKPAQFGRGAMADVGQKLLDLFADRLAALLEGKQEEPAAAATADSPAATPAPVVSATDEDDVIDLYDLAGAAVAKRVLPVVAALAAVAAIIWWFRRRTV